MSLFCKKEPCQHFNIQSTFEDLHRGGPGDTLYFRAKHKCKMCGFSFFTATPIPRKLIDIIDDSDYWEQLSQLASLKSELGL
jgi:hypothetical protein